MQDKVLKRVVLDKHSPLPLYYQLKQVIQGAIEDGTLLPGEMLPPEMAFCDEFGISRATIRQALSELMQEGYLDRQRGKGTFVTVPKIDARFLNKLESFSEEMRQKGLTPSTRVLTLSLLEGASHINQKLGLDDAEKLIYLERLRCTDGEPIVYLETYLPHRLFAPLLSYDFEAHSLYDLMEQICGLRLTHVTRRIEAVNATPEESMLLQVGKDAALCLVKTTGYTAENVAIEYSVARYRGDRNEFSVELYR